jgi:ABC-2 type transport system permease protein
MRAFRAQVMAEITMTLQRGESLLVTLGIPAFLLVFFSEVHVLPTGDSHPVDFLTPGVLALAVMSTAMVSLGIATGFERSYGVLKRLGSTPLGRPRLLAAKIVSVLAVEVVQVAVLVAIAYGLGWQPHGSAGLAVVAEMLATVAFAGIGLAMAGALRAEVNLALANGVYLVLLLIGGIVFPVTKLRGFAVVARALPTAALSRALQATLGGTGALTSVPAESWIVLAIWAVAAPVVAGLSFRWE